MSGVRERGATGSGSDAENDEDAALADWVAEISERLERGEPVDPDALASAHPDRVDEVLRLLPALRRMAALGRTAPRPEPPAGLGTLGDFRLLREVGRGGMGIVYEAEQLSLGRRVALKILPLAAALDPRRRQRFLQEAKAAAGLTHPHIVPVYAVGSERGVPYYAMQFLDGGTLAEVLRALRGGPSDSGHPPDAETRPGASLGRSFRDPDYIRAVADCGRKVAEALDHAHRRGILHRDIKPANLMLDGRGGLWITDFGLAQVEGDSRLTLTGDLVGTLRYMSPEQALGTRGTVDGRSDVYSLGATLYELLTLRPVFAGADRVETLRRIAQGEPTPPRHLNPSVPRDLETILQTALAREPSGRYATAGEMAEDLRRFHDDRPIRARRPTIAGRAWRWARRHRRQVAIGAATTILLIAAGSLEWRRQRGKQAGFEAALRAQAARADAQEREAASRRREADLLRYADRIQRADRALRANDLPAARAILDAIAPSSEGFDPREFTFGYLWRRAHPIETIPNPAGHARSCTHVSADGLTLATHDENGPLFLLDGETGRLRTALRPTPGGWGQLNLSPDGRFVATHTLGGRDGSEGLGLAWDAVTGRHLAELRRGPGLKVFCMHVVAGGRLVTEEVSEHGPSGTFLWEPRADSREPRLIARLTEGTGGVFNHVSPDGLTFATMTRGLDPGKVGRWIYEFHDTRTGTLLRRIATEGEPVNGHIGFAFLEGGATLADLDSSGRVTFWDIRTGAALDRRPFPGWSEWEYASFGDDGRSFVDVRARGGPLVLWDRDRGWTHTLPIGDPGAAPSQSFASFLPGSAQVAASGYSASRGWSAPWVYDVETGARLATCPEWTDPAAVMSLAIRRRGRDLLINQGPASKVWRIDATIGYDALAGHRDEAWCVTFSPDGELLASGSDDDDPRTVKLWDAATGRLVREWNAHPGTTAAVAFQPGGRLLATAGLFASENLRLWNLRTGALAATLDGHTDRVRAIAFSPDGRLLASGGSDGAVRLWEVATRRLAATLDGHSSPIRQVAFAPDGRTLASAGGDATVRLWEVDRPSPIRSWSGEVKVSALAFSPDGRTLAWADESGVIRLLDATRNVIRSTMRGEPEEVRALAFAPDGRTLASAGHPGTIRLWDPASGQELLTMPGRPSQVNALAFSPDGRALAACWHDGTVRIMRADSIARAIPPGSK